MTETFPILDPIWCAGCGHFSVLRALAESLDRLGIEAHRTLVMAGIGCSGAVQNYVRAYGYHALHGRVLPTATGAKLANPQLTVVAAGGDGDGLAIGAGHLVHAFRSNPAITYILMNNSTYGLTKGQPSPTSQSGYRGNRDGEEIDPVLLGLALPGTTFLARGYSGAFAQLERLTDAAIAHAEEGRGFAFLEVISPCVAYNDRYAAWPAQLVNLDDDPTHDAADRTAVFTRLTEIGSDGRIPTGLLFRRPDTVLDGNPTGPAQSDIDPANNRSAYDKILLSFRA